MNHRFKLLILLSALFIFASCSKDNDTTPAHAEQKTRIDEKKTTTGMSVTLWADNKDITVSWNKLYISLKNTDGSAVTNAVVSYTPVMNMMTMEHSSPVEQPSYNADQALYEGAIVFSMPTGDMGTWTLTVTVNNEPVVFNVNVKPTLPNTKHTGTFVGTDGVSYTVSLVQPLLPKTGLNELQILINKRQGMMSFPPVEDLTVELTPEMPSMNHGSPNNVNPVHTGKGRYSGKVNFTMTGDWRLHLRLKRGNTTIVEDAPLDLLF